MNQTCNPFFHQVNNFLRQSVPLLVGPSRVRFDFFFSQTSHFINFTDFWFLVDINVSLEYHDS